jgi:hypothetical protein
VCEGFGQGARCGRVLGEVQGVRGARYARVLGKAQGVRGFWASEDDWVGFFWAGWCWDITIMITNHVNEYAIPLTPKG